MHALFEDVQLLFSKQRSSEVCVVHTDVKCECSNPESLAAWHEPLMIILLIPKSVVSQKHV